MRSRQPWIARVLVPIIPCLVISFVLLAVTAAAAEAVLVAIVDKNVNLRHDPSASHPPIRLLLPPEKLDLLDPTAQHHYLHVRTSANEEGWVWKANVHIEGTAGTNTTGGQVAASISPTWDKPAPNHTQFTSPGRNSPCGPTGDDGDVDTNLRKNRTDVPSAYNPVTFDAIATLAYPVAGRQRSSWTPAQLAEIAPYEGVAVTVTGYMAALKPQTGGSGESTNCHWTHASEVDWHIALTKSAKQGEPDAIVVETTPRVRKYHPKWTTAALRPWVESATHTSENPIRISGWLMMDPEHRNHLGRYRTTLWEVHPITKIEVFKDGAWVDLDTAP